MKHHLKRVVGTKVPTMEEFNTYLLQIEGIINSRPLSEMSNDHSDIKALTPVHCLVGKPLLRFNEQQSEPQDEQKLPERYRLLEKMKLSFWKSWSRDYLESLQIRKKWYREYSGMEKLDRVLIAVDNLRPLQWKLGRIIETYSGNDNLIRVVKLKTTSGELMRAVVNLRKLPPNSQSPQIFNRVEEPSKVEVFT